MTKVESAVQEIAKVVAKSGGRALLVGGSVRDNLLGLPPVDFDVEIYGLLASRVEEIVRGFGPVSEVGKAFGILKLTVDGADIDISLPRTDSKTGEGHKGFAVATDPSMTPYEAARRRDFTINAIAEDPLTGEIIDPFGGVADLEKKILRVVDRDLFGDDPLRVLRAMQFIGRFGLTVESESFKLMQSMARSLKEISPKRIGDEWRKLLLKSAKPSLGLQFGMEVGAFQVLHPELIELAKTPQEPEWHPEGDVWVHTMMVVDEAAKIVFRESLEDEKALVLLLGALCHDFGKPYVTCLEEGRIRSHGHEEAGVVPTTSFLKTLSISGETIDKVVGIVRDHMKPYRLWHEEIVKGTPIGDGAIRRLAMRIHPATIAELVDVTEADFLGRGPFTVAGKPGEFMPPGEYSAGIWLCERASRLGVLGSRPEHILSGRELVDMGFAPGPLMGDLVRLSDELRDEKDWCHYNLVALLKEISVDNQGNRDATAALERLKLELD